MKPGCAPTAPLRPIRRSGFRPPPPAALDRGYTNFPMRVTELPLGLEPQHQARSPGGGAGSATWLIRQLSRRLRQVAAFAIARILIVDPIVGVDVLRRDSVALLQERHQPQPSL